MLRGSTSAHRGLHLHCTWTATIPSIASCDGMSKVNLAAIVNALSTQSNTWTDCRQGQGISGAATRIAEWRRAEMQGVGVMCMGWWLVESPRLLDVWCRPHSHSLSQTSLQQRSSRNDTQRALQSRPAHSSLTSPRRTRIPCECECGLTLSARTPPHPAMT